MKKLLLLLLLLTVLTLVLAFTPLVMADEPEPQNLPIIGAMYGVLETPQNVVTNFKASCDQGTLQCVFAPLTSLARGGLNLLTRVVATSTVGWTGGYQRGYAQDGEFAMRLVPWGGDGHTMTAALSSSAP